MKKPGTRQLLAWFLLNLIVGVLMELGLFSQTLPGSERHTEIYKVFVAQAWASLEWVFLIPANRIGNSFLTAPQLSLSSFVFDFIGQIGANRYWLGLETTLDDYIAMGIILGASVISGYRLAG